MPCAWQHMALAPGLALMLGFCQQQTPSLHLPDPRLTWIPCQAARVLLPSPFHSLPLPRPSSPLSLGLRTSLWGGNSHVLSMPSEPDTVLCLILTSEPGGSINMCPCVADEGAKPPSGQAACWAAASGGRGAPQRALEAMSVPQPRATPSSRAWALPCSA